MTMSDSVAENSGFLKTYMSNHPDTLVAYIKWFGKVAENVVSPEMTAIDSKSMTLTYKTKDGASKLSIVPIEPPLSGYEEAKSRLLGMKAEAQEGLGIIKAPQISNFVVPKNAGITAFLMAFLIHGTLFPRGDPSPWFLPVRVALWIVGGEFGLKLIWGFVVIAHILEGAYTYSLCRRHCTGFWVGAAYFFGNLMFGFPFLVGLRKRIHDARMESVMKGE